MRVLLLAVVLVLGGCASTGVTVRRLPSETPAADNAALIQKMADASQEGAAMAQAEHRNGAQSPSEDSPPLTPEEAPSMYSYDPLERFNRWSYNFNAQFDEHVFLPVSNGYRHVPGPVRAGVHNFFHNLGEVTSTANYILQLRLKGGARSLGRFVINSTIGIGGLFDVAKKLKLSPEQTGFGATLSTWGVPPGPYLMIPILGPSTLRDGVGLLGDYGIEYGVNVADLYRGYQSWGLYVVNSVDTRANITFRYYGSGSPFEYETTRFLYVHRDLIQDEALRKIRRHKKK
jgi:phospholipid-binding lipoprotein MlaA